MEKAGLYIHIPFCVQKCLYCDFLSFSGRFQYAKQYADQVCREIEFKKDWGKKLEFDSVFIGGGTPSSIEPEWIAQILNKARTVFSFAPDSEITIEVNPGTLSQAKLKAYSEMGINRVSMGMQSTSDRLLHSIGRVHSKEEGIHCALTLAQYFTNRNIDLISGIPGIDGEQPQTMAELQEDLAFITAMQVPHVSIYSMITEPGTPLYQLTQENKVIACDDELERQMYHHIREYLILNGYDHYEVSNFARPGYVCKHNMKYWQGSPYLGIGLGSASFLPWDHNSDTYVRSTNETDLMKYLDQVEFAPKEEILIPLDERRCEYMMLGFRRIKGPDPELYQSLFQQDLYKDFDSHLSYLHTMEYIRSDLSLTKKGMDYANHIFEMFV